MFSSARFRSVLLAALTLASVAVAAPDDALAQAASGRRPITETDIFAFNWIADPQISPDGSSIVFVKVTVNEKKDGYDTALWVVATSGGAGERRLTSGPRDQSPRWSPDGSRIAFLRTVDTAGRPQPQIHLLPMRGGEATALSSLPRGASVAGVVAGRQEDRVHQHDAPGRSDEAGRRQATRVRRARHQPRGLPRQRRRLSRPRAAGVDLGHRRSRHVHHGADAEPADDGRVRRDQSRMGERRQPDLLHLDTCRRAVLRASRP